jgi:hypothetical protein
MLVMLLQIKYIQTVINVQKLKLPLMEQFNLNYKGNIRHFTYMGTFRSLFIISIIICVLPIISSIIIFETMINSGNYEHIWFPITI